MHHPYHQQSAASVAALDIDPEAVIARQEVMIQSGTHNMIAEKLARDAVLNQTLRDQHVKPVIATPAPIIAAAPIITDTIA